MVNLRPSFPVIFFYFARCALYLRHYKVITSTGLSHWYGPWSSRSTSSLCVSSCKARGSPGGRFDHTCWLVQLHYLTIFKYAYMRTFYGGHIMLRSFSLLSVWFSFRASWVARRTNRIHAELETNRMMLKKGIRYGYIKINGTRRHVTGPS